MTVKYHHAPGRVYAEEDGVPFFDTDAYPVQFFPLADEIAILGQSIAFPDFHKANAYAFASGALGAGERQGCHSFITIPFQDWGPDDDTPAPSDVLDTEIIGTVPAATDILFVRVNLARTTSPSQVNGEDVDVSFKEGELVVCPGGSLLMEWKLPIARSIQIDLAVDDNGDGTRNVLLKRKMSIKKKRYTFWRGDGNASQNGWTFGGTNGAYGNIVSSIEAAGPSAMTAGPTMQRGGAAACSLTDNTDYSSVFTGDIFITPGCTNIEVFAAHIGPTFAYTDHDIQNPNTTTHTYTDLSIGVAKSTRRVIVAVAGYKGADTTSRAISAVTIGGAAATKLIERDTYDNQSGSNDSTYITSFYYCDIPTGTTATVAVTFSSSFWHSAVWVLATYDLVSPTPDATLATASTGVQHIATQPAGMIFGSLFYGGSVGNDGETPFAPSGISGVAAEYLQTSAPSTRTVSFALVFQYTSSTNVDVTLPTGFGASSQSFCAVSLH